MSLSLVTSTSAPAANAVAVWMAPGAALIRTKKRLHEAEEHRKTTIALEANSAQHYVHLGQVYRTGHLFDGARKQSEMALRLDRLRGT